MLYFPSVSYFAVFSAFPPLPLNEENFIFLSAFQYPASQDAYSFLESQVAPACLEDLWNSLLAARWHFLSEGRYSCFTSWVSHMGWSHFFTSQALSIWFPYSSVELLFQPEGIWSPRIPSTHIRWILQSHLSWLDAEPYPGKHMVDYVHSAPYWRFPISQGFGLRGIQGGKSLVLPLYSPFSRY